MVGQAGEGQGFDGNGPFLRCRRPGRRDPGQERQDQRPTTRDEPLFANFTSPPQRTRPAFPGKAPPLRRDGPATRTRVPDVNGPASVGPADGSRPNAAAPPLHESASAVAASLPSAAQ